MVPIRHNQVVDSLATTAGNFKVAIYSNKKYKIEVINKPSIPDNSKYQQVFEDDLQIKIFLEILDEVVNTNIDTENQNLENIQDDEHFADEEIEQKNLKNMIGGKNIIQLKSYHIPKGLIPIEKLFDQNDVAKDPIDQDHNIGTKDCPKIVNISKNLPA